MSDLISRQAVIDACEQSINILEAVDRIMDLPSVNPQKSVIEDIKAEIEKIEIFGYVDMNTSFIRDGENVKNLALKIIDNHISGKE